jgi:hydroxymethylpyrimidine kinase/phosphomethylpyrimidine kinase/thiamine-phosphate diphosphorylase
MGKPAVLVIGGFDPQGAAGVVTDCLTVNAHGCHPVPVISAMTEQTQQGLTNLGAVSVEQFMSNYECAVADYDIKAIKIGLIPNTDLLDAVLIILGQLNVPVVWDPVLASTSGGVSVDQAVQTALIEKALAKITLLTPNRTELTQLSGTNQSEHAVTAMLNQGLNACLVKGGHSQSSWATDWYVSQNNAFYCYDEKQSKSVRGTGCALASSIAANLALGLDIRDAVVMAKAYLTRGIRLAEHVGPYSVLHHSSQAFELIDMPKLTYEADQVGAEFNFPSCSERLGIYPVVDSADWVEKLTREGIQTIQLRVKNRNHDEIEAEIKQAVSVCDDAIAFFVNDYWAQAIKANAYGVHLGQEDLHDANLKEIEKAGLRLGVSTHSYWELARALAINPSYIALGPVYATTSKEMPWIPQGAERVKQWTRLLGDQYPLVAIGGIDLDRAKTLKETGVGSVAMISAITQSADYQSATNALLKLWE